MIDLPALNLTGRSPFDVRIELTRFQLESCAAKVIADTIEITRRAVEDAAELRWNKIDEVILVGGQTRMPAIQREVEKLTGRKPRVNDRPQLAVGLGAGEYARILGLGQEKFHENALINVLALPLGVRVDTEKQKDMFQLLIKANATLPTGNQANPFEASTTKDDQARIRVDVLQGPRDATRADQCVLLGTIDMDVWPLAPKGVPKFEIIFDVRSDGTLTVVVTDKRSNKSKTIDIFEPKVVLKEKIPEPE